MADPDRGPELRVAATAPVVLDSSASNYDPGAIESVRDTIMSRLGMLVEDPRVTIEQALPDVVR